MYFDIDYVPCCDFTRVLSRRVIRIKTLLFLAADDIEGEVGEGFEIAEG